MLPLGHNSLVVLIAQICAILVVSRLLWLALARMGQPLVIAEMVAGVALGPSVLGALWPQGVELLFPQSSLPALKGLSQIGLVLFMFLVGLELDLRLLRGRAYVVVAQAGIIVPFALGSVAGILMSDSYCPPGVPRVGFVLFCGTAMSVTAFPVLARILSEGNLVSPKLSGLALSCAAINDVAAWCMLAVVVAIARASGFAGVLWTCGLAVAFGLFMAFVVRPWLHAIGRKHARGWASSSAVTFALLLLLLSSAATELIGIHALFGAFVLGVIFPRDGSWAPSLTEKLEAVSVILLMPLFFAYSGLQTEIALLSQPREWVVAIALLACATLGKFGGTTIAARVTGLGWREAGAIGILMNTRGLMELVVLNIGRELGVIPPAVFSMLVVTALVTTVATVPVLRWLYPQAVEDAQVSPGREPSTALGPS